MKMNFYLENGIYCKGEHDDFKLYYERSTLTDTCCNISYIPKILIALKSGNTILVYKPIIIKSQNVPMLSKIATLEINDTSAYLYLKFHNGTYIIDSNVQIEFYSRIW